VKEVESGRSGERREESEKIFFLSSLHFPLKRLIQKMAIFILNFK
jgi:hypothetical protein